MKVQVNMNHIDIHHIHTLFSDFVKIPKNKKNQTSQILLLKIDVPPPSLQTLFFLLSQNRISHPIHILMFKPKLEPTPLKHWIL